MIRSPLAVISGKHGGKAGATIDFCDDEVPGDPAASAMMCGTDVPTPPMRPCNHGRGLLHFATFHRKETP